jgi:hypothetical protein
VPALERRVLILRSGFGSPRPSSRARVARALELSTRRVTRLERRGLRRLRALARRGCGGSATKGGEVSAIRVSAPATSGFGRALLAAATFGGGTPDRIEVKGEQQSSGPAGSGSGAGTTPRLAAPAAQPKTLPPAAGVAGSGGASGLPGFALIAGLLLLGVVVVGFVIEARRAVRPR